MARKRSAKTTAAVSNAIEEAFKRESITTQRMDLAIRDLQWDAKTYSFRDTEKLTDAAIKTLADSIREAGVLFVPLLVKRIDAGFLESTAIAASWPWRCLRKTLLVATGQAIR